tara:strand:+ start:9225 stop:10448 length:1224 start_codon:yes stop_codon:yes gene_type:complete
MSSSPFKQSYRTVEDPNAVNKSTLNTVNNLGDLNEEKRKEVGNYSVEMQEIINNGGELSAAEYNNVHDTLKNEMQPLYIEASSPKEKALLQREQTMMAESADDFSRIKTDIAESWDDGTLNSNWKNTQRGKAVLEVITNKDSVLKKKGCPEGEECNDEGEFGVMMPDFGVVDAANDQIRYLDNQINELESSGTYDEKVMEDLYSQRQELQNVIEAKPLKWTSMQELESMVKKVDEPVKQGIIKAGQDYKKIGMSSTPEEEILFNKAGAKDFVDGSIIAKGDKDSLIYDEMIPGRTFYNDLKNWIKGADTGGRTYRDLGITDSQLADADINGDGKIDDNEAKNLADALINNRELDGNGKLMVDNYLSDYYVNFLENQHKLGAGNKKKKETKNKGKRNKYIPGSLSRKV